MISTGGIRSGARSVGTLAIKMNEVARKRLGVQLPEQGGNLAAMIGAVIDHVLHGLPERIFVCAKIEGAVFMDAIQVVLSEAGYEFLQALLVLVPA